MADGQSPPLLQPAVDYDKPYKIACCGDAEKARAVSRHDVVWPPANPDSVNLAALFPVDQRDSSIICICGNQPTATAETVTATGPA